MSLHKIQKFPYEILIFIQKSWLEKVEILHLNDDKSILEALCLRKHCNKIFDNSVLLKYTIDTI